MTRLRRFVHLPVGEQWLLVKTALLLGTIRLGLRLIPFRTLQRAVTQLARMSVSSSQSNHTSVDRLVWAVTVASQYTPNATCLTQALAGQVLLGWHGYPAHLRVGVARSDEGRIQGHAWLESQGRVVLGGEELSRYTVLRV